MTDTPSSMVVSALNSLLLISIILIYWMKIFKTTISISYGGELVLMGWQQT